MENLKVVLHQVDGTQLDEDLLFIEAPHGKKKNAFMTLDLLSMPSNGSRTSKDTSSSSPHQEMIKTISDQQINLKR